MSSEKTSSRLACATSPSPWLALPPANANSAFAARACNQGNFEVEFQVAAARPPAFKAVLHFSLISSVFRAGVNVMSERWTPDSWRQKPLLQMPDYPDT